MFYIDYIHFQVTGVYFHPERGVCIKGGMDKDTVLFGKYRLLRQAGSGRSGTVWQAFHLGLEEYRAVKVVSKSSKDPGDLRREALILKELRHPGIPLVYDLEEDEYNFYLIEEYLEGCSLYSYVTEHGILMKEEVIRYGSQLCSLVDYMHSAWNEPILHLDIQPRNLILGNGSIRLIDFEYAARPLRAYEGRERYGTMGCAAPEQYTDGRTLDERTDVYAIGAVLRFMLCGTLREGTQRRQADTELLEEIIEKCMEPDMERRYRSAEEVSRALERLTAGTAPARCDHRADSSLNLILTGSRPGAGVTHMAFGLCHFLNQKGIKALYEEHTRSRAVLTMACRDRLRPDDHGIYQICGCPMKPWYGQAAKLPCPEDYKVVIRDFGTRWQEAAGEQKKRGGIVLCICCESPWEQGQTEQMLEQLDLLKEGAAAALGYRRLDPGRFKRAGSPRTLDRQVRTWLKKNRIPVFGIPEYRNPFRPEKETQAFFGALWEYVKEKEKA